MSTVVFQSKVVGEEVTLDMNFLSRLAVGETLQTVDRTVVVASGVDANPNAMLSGAATISGSIVRQMIIGGLPGVIYLFIVAVRTSNSQLLFNHGNVAVLSNLPMTLP